MSYVYDVLTMLEKQHGDNAIIPKMVTDIENPIKDVDLVLRRIILEAHAIRPSARRTEANAFIAK